MKPKILVADSEEMFAEAVAYVLEQAGFEAVAAHDSRLALECARDWHPDLCILSAALLPVSQFQLCCDLRRKEMAAYDSPILMLGTDTHEETRVAVLECGVDDYLVKPFGMKEFMARVHALLRRAKVPLDLEQTEDARGDVRVGQFFLNLMRLLLIIEDEKGECRTIPVTRKEAQILHVLMSQAGSIVTREKLIERIWDETEVAPDSNTLDVQLGTLRRKLGETASSPKHLFTVRGRGFRFQV